MVSWSSSRDPNQSVLPASELPGSENRRLGATRTSPPDRYGQAIQGSRYLNSKCAFPVFPLIHLNRCNVHGERCCLTLFRSLRANRSTFPGPCSSGLSDGKFCSQCQVFPGLFCQPSARSDDPSSSHSIRIPKGLHDSFPGLMVSIANLWQFPRFWQSSPPSPSNTHPRLAWIWTVASQVTPYWRGLGQ